MTRDAVLRINTQGDQRLRREALVAAVLPAGHRLPAPHRLRRRPQLRLARHRAGARPAAQPVLADDVRDRPAATRSTSSATGCACCTRRRRPTSRPCATSPSCSSRRDRASDAVAPLIAGLRRAAGLPRSTPG